MSLSKKPLSPGSSTKGSKEQKQITVDSREDHTRPLKEMSCLAEERMNWTDRLMKSLHKSKSKAERSCFEGLIFLVEKLKVFSQESAAKIVELTHFNVMLTNNTGQAMVVDGMLELSALMEGV
jgi:hypothetical protein